MVMYCTLIRLYTGNEIQDSNVQLAGPGNE